VRRVLRLPGQPLLFSKSVETGPIISETHQGEDLLGKLVNMSEKAFPLNASD
jgi:hypothetical protein